MSRKKISKGRRWPVVAFVVGWLACGLLSAGLEVAHFQRKFPLTAKESYGYELRSCLTLGLGGPANLVATLFFLSDTGFYGWTLLPNTEGK